jgi:hypothetical protein
MQDNAMQPLLTLLGPSPQPQRLSLAEWDLVVRQARRANVLARIAALVQAHGKWNAVAPAPRQHLASALALATRQQRELRFEVAQIARALQPTGLPVVLLKGGAYALAGLQASLGRMVSDVDILVPRERLVDVETALMMAGWVHTNHDAYDQHYYRTWMHELPPMRHLQRGTVLDVHHALVPATARVRPSTQRLLQAAQALPGQPGVCVLAPADMLLHSAAHLFHESDFAQGFRGVVDIDALLREFSAVPGFWPDLLERAAVLGLQWPLHHALSYAQAITQTPVPASTMAALAPGVGQQAWQHRLRDALYLRTLRPDHASTADAWTPLARGLLYLNGHRLRMPLHLLLPHLLRKALGGLLPKEKP